MKTKLFITALVLALGAAIPLFAATPSSDGLQIPIPITAKKVPGPVPGNTMTSAYVQSVGRMAYVWGYPLVNAHNRRVAFAEAPEIALRPLLIYPRKPS